MCEIFLPRVAEEEIGKKSVEIPGKAEKDKESLQTQMFGIQKLQNTLDSEPKLRVNSGHQERCRRLK